MCLPVYVCLNANTAVCESMCVCEYLFMRNHDKDYTLSCSHEGRRQRGKMRRGMKKDGDCLCVCVEGGGGTPWGLINSCN